MFWNEQSEEKKKLMFPDFTDAVNLSVYVCILYVL